MNDALEADYTEQPTSYRSSSNCDENNDAEHAAGISTRDALQKSALVRGVSHGRAIAEEDAAGQVVVVLASLP